jgi:hypothetical protein
MITGATMTGPKGMMRGAPASAVSSSNRWLLNGGPAGAAEFLGPAVAQPALLAKDLGPALQIVARQFERVVHLVRNLLGEVFLDPGANFFAELLFFGCEAQIHACLAVLIGSPQTRCVSGTAVFSTVVLRSGVRAATRKGAHG